MSYGDSRYGDRSSYRGGDRGGGRDGGYGGGGGFGGGRGGGGGGDRNYSNFNEVPFLIYFILIILRLGQWLEDYSLGFISSPSF